MTKNFIEVGETYQSVCRASFECIHVDEAFAWCKNKHGPAYVFYLDGTPFAVGPEYRLLPPGPRIAKNDTKLWQNINLEFCVSGYGGDGTSGQLYTHEDAKVAIFVPEQIDKGLFDDAVIALRKEIGQCPTTRKT